MVKIVFFGTPAFAVPTLEELLRSVHDVAGVVTQPDRPSGRGGKTIAGPVKQLAIASGRPVLQPERLKTDDFIQQLTALAPDLGVVAAYGKILPASVLAIPRLGMLNVHASLLPRYRGAAPIHRAVIAGETITGVTIMRVVPALDAGPTLVHESIPIGPDARSDDIERELAIIGGRALLRCVDTLESASIVETPQDDAQATYAPRLMKDESPIVWESSAAAVHNKVRGLQPWPRASTTLRGERFIIHRTARSQAYTNAPSGTIVEAAGASLFAACGRGETLQLLEIQPEGRRVLSAREFLAGHRIAAGDRFD